MSRLTLRHWNLVTTFVALVAIVSNASAQTVTVDFNGLVDPGEDREVTDYSSSGFTFTPGLGTLYVYSNTYDPPSTPPNNTDFLGNENAGQQQIQLDATGEFDLESFEAAQIFSGSTAMLTVTGSLAAGGQVVTMFSLPSPAGSAVWNTFTLPATFTGLTSVTFSSNNSVGLGMDNVVLSAAGGPAAVPAMPPFALIALLLLMAVVGSHQVLRRC